VTGIPGHTRGLLHQDHAVHCSDGTEYSGVETAAWGDGFAVIYAEWCGECGAADWELVDTIQPEPEDVRP